MDVRLATIDDLSSIIEIVQLVVPLMQADGNFQWSLDTYPLESDFRRDISNGVLYVAFDEMNKVVGVCALTTDQGADYLAAWPDTQQAIVPHRLAVHPESHGKGTARAIMAYAENLAKARNMLSVRLDTSTKNKATNTLFPKIGYTFVAEISLRGREPQRFNCYEKYV